MLQDDLVLRLTTLLARTEADVADAAAALSTASDVDWVSVSAGVYRARLASVRTLLLGGADDAVTVRTSLARLALA